MCDSVRLLFFFFFSSWHMGKRHGMGKRDSGGTNTATATHVRLAASPHASHASCAGARCIRAVASASPAARASVPPAGGSQSISKCAREIGRPGNRADSQSISKRAREIQMSVLVT